MRLHVEKRVLLGFVVTALVLAVLGVFSFTSTQRLINTARLSSHATRVINNAEQVVKAVVDIETGQRGFTLTGKEEFLVPFYESSKNVGIYLNTLDSLTAQNPLQQAKVVELRAFIHHQLNWTKTVIDARRQNFERARDMVASGEGKRTTDAIRGIVNDVQNDEREIFRKGNTISRDNLQALQNSSIGLAAAITVVIVFLFYTINKTLKTRDEVEEKLKEYQYFFNNNHDLVCIANTNGYFETLNPKWENVLGYSQKEMIEKQFLEFIHPDDIDSTLKEVEKLKKGAITINFVNRYRKKDGSYLWFDWNSTPNPVTGKLYAIARDITERKKTEDKIKQLNQELEAFTYSVSHDLRAPLRSIMGYSQILNEDYGGKLDDEGNRIMQVIINNAKRMGQLIDDLLDFTRLGRKELSHVHVNMAELVQSIVQELMAQEIKRQMNIRVLPLL